MNTQTEHFAFCADHTTDFRRCSTRHGHTFELSVETSFEGDHATIRGTVGRAVLSKLHMAFLNDISDLDQGEGGTVEAVIEWARVQLEATPVRPVSITVTELSASKTFEPVRHTKTWSLDR